ncbi:MAG: MBL fold metallo-hydrolase [Balneolaceae bacterium]|nr:MAG: MBL fold metallo-hydrolase [Balneolaceae bacterium]
MIEQLSEGFFEIFEDGTFQKMDPARLDNVSEDTSLGKYSSALGIDPLLIQLSGKTIVIDPGLGWGLDHTSSYHDTSSVVTNLDIFEISPEDVDLVILSHLHYDHMAGCTYVDENQKTQATFPNARYLVHKEEFDYALTQTGTKYHSKGALYNLDEFYKLIAEKRVDFISQSIFSPLQGISLIKTGGHTPGHLIAKIIDEEEIFYFLGDLVPTEYHLNHYAMKQIDYDPVQTKKTKRFVLNNATEENATLFFYHSLFQKSGRISLNKKNQFTLSQPSSS